MSANDRADLRIGNPTRKCVVCGKPTVQYRHERWKWKKTCGAKSCLRESKVHADRYCPGATVNWDRQLATMYHAELVGRAYTLRAQFVHGRA